MPLTKYEDIFPNLCKRLKQTKAKNRTGQAYLLVGDDIAFLEKFAMDWAQTAVCQSPLPDGAACCKCEACTAFMHNAYTELFVVRPTSKSRAITVESMREFEHIVSLSTPHGLLKVGMIVEAERMNDNAQNAFLKTLEEPPADTMLMLLTVNARMLLPTIKSRCQTLALLRNKQDYATVGEQGLFKYLMLLRRQAGASNAIRAAAGITKILAAQHAIAEEIAKANRDTTWDNVDDAKIAKQLEEEFAAKVEAEYVKQRGIITGAIQAWFLQRMLLASGASKELLPNPEMFDGIELAVGSPDEASQDIKYVEDFLKCLAGNVDEKLALDTLCLSVCEKNVR